MGLNNYPRRGENYLVNLDPTIGAEINKTRPAVIISNDLNNKYSETVTIIPITSKVAKVYPFEVILTSGTLSGLEKKSKAKCSQIRTIDKCRLHKRMGRVSDSELEEIEKAIILHLGFYYEE